MADKVVIKDVAKVLRISVRSVRKFMLVMGVDMPVWKGGKTQIPLFTANQLIAEYQYRLNTITNSMRAWTIKEMSELLCLSTSTLYRACRELGYSYKGGVDKAHAPLLAYYGRREQGWYRTKAA